ncbi:MAG: YciI family protein [Candidatus Thorarchaeota archaeon]|nr:YciI family protein [Candidatus Thorarchaeota archaeon]
METQSYVIILRPANEYGNPGTNERVNEHFEYLKGLLEKGVLTMAGRFSEVLIGLDIIETPSQEEALRIMKDDPAVKSGVFHAELHPWRIALKAK